MKKYRITLKHGQKIFFTGDSHYNHLNLCSATTKWENAGDIVRNFDSMDDMNDTIVNGINSVVGEDDILFHVGDFSFNGIENIGIFRSRIKCKTIYIIPGNHDDHISNNKNNVHDFFEDVLDQIVYLIVKIPFEKRYIKKVYIVSHYPIASWIDMNGGHYHLHGHVHLNEQHKVGTGRSLDVGVEGNNYIPYSVDKIDELLSDREIKRLILPVDHHEKRIE